MTWIVVAEIISEETEGCPREIDSLWGPFRLEHAAQAFVSERHNGAVCDDEGLSYYVRRVRSPKEKR